LFSEFKNAKKLSSKLEQKELDSQIIDDIKDGSSIYRVIIGSFQSKEIAQALLQDIRNSHSINLYLTMTNSKNRSNCLVSL
jgi:cell division protein FtsN